MSSKFGERHTLVVQCSSLFNLSFAQELAVSSFNAVELEVADDGFAITVELGRQFENGRFRSVGGDHLVNLVIT